MTGRHSIESPEHRPDPPQTIIGVFDSGFGGLTVLRALLHRLPGVHFIYLGDTARLPYGAKSHITVARYAAESARFLVDHGAQLLVIACNTATALALPDIRAAVSVPVIGVVEPGAQAAFAAAQTSNLNSESPSAAATSPQAVILSEAKDLRISPSESRRREPEPSALTATSSQAGILSEAKDLRISPSESRRREPESSHVLVLATAATVQSHAYRQTLNDLGLQATEKACPLLVPLVEEGWTDHPVTDEVIRIYLTEALTETQPGAVLLGCTHYPLIAPAITNALRQLGSEATVVDSAEATAEAVRLALPKLPSSTTPATYECFATDSVEKFARLGSHFLGRPIPHVHLLDLGG